MHVSESVFHSCRSLQDGRCVPPARESPVGLSHSSLAHRYLSTGFAGMKFVWQLRYELEDGTGAEIVMQFDNILAPIRS